MNRYYITEQLIYMCPINEERILLSDNRISFMGDVYVNGLYKDHKNTYLCGSKLKDKVVIIISSDTPSIQF